MKAPALLWGDGRINVWQSNAALSDGAAGALVCRSHSTRSREGLAGAVSGPLRGALRQRTGAS